MGNFSRNTFDRLKHYVGVRLQQGVPLVDADWNELEDIRKYELQAYLKWYVGDGVPANNDGFLITPIGAAVDDFMIAGGDGTAEGAGRCLVDGWDVINESNLQYSSQALFENTDLATAWGVDPVPALTVPAGTRTDVVYLDVWEREVDSSEDSNIINPVIGVETSVRLKREWVVRVVENALVPPTAAAGHAFYVLATLSRDGALLTINDQRETGINLVEQKRELANLQDDLQTHQLDTGNPHNVTAAQTNALALSDYDFRLRTAATVSFTQFDANSATRTVTTGFRTQFVWVVGYCSTTLQGHIFGANASAHADLRSGFIQRGTSSEIYRYSVAPYWRQTANVVNALLSVKFRNETVTPAQDETIGISVSNRTDTQITFRLSRSVPGSSSTATSTATGTGTAASAVALPSFQARLFVLCFG